MAIFGAGSNWEGVEMKDLYDMISILKAGDIVYLKSNQSGSRTLRIKGIGIVCQSLIHNYFDTKTKSKNINIAKKMKWIFKNEFKIIIPKNEGKLTNFRAATFYEEFLPIVQSQIIEKLFN